ncbi:MAG: hypothetical protein GX416_06925 [Bacteroidales bacterium]|nr:hypothetical protein [Bacteroidales bacterium]
MKKRISMIFILLLVSMGGYSQIPKGFWQQNSSQIGKKRMAGYTFGDNHRFEYTISEYDGLNPIVALGGTYRINRNKIYYKVNYIKKRIGGKLCRNGQYTLNDSWAFVGNQITVIKLKHAINESGKIYSMTRKYIDLSSDYKYYKTRLNSSL